MLTTAGAALATASAKDLCRSFWEGGNGAASTEATGGLAVLSNRFDRTNSTTHATMRPTSAQRKMNVRVCFMGATISADSRDADSSFAARRVRRFKAPHLLCV
jgi:hypothetical protein